MFRRVLEIVLSKKIVFILCVVIVVSLIFTGCSQVNKVDKMPIESTNVRFIELEEKYPPDIAYSEWIQLEENDIIDWANLILRGKIMDKKEYAIEEIVSDEFTRTYYKTIYSVEISDIYYSDNNDVKVGNTIKVMSPVTSYNWEPEAVQMEKGQEFILFASLVKDSGTIKFSDLAKYFIGNPWKPIISVKEDSFEMDVVFDSLAKNSTIKERKISENYAKKVLVRKDKDFIADLKDLISKYKNK